MGGEGAACFYASPVIADVRAASGLLETLAAKQPPRAGLLCTGTKVPHPPHSVRGKSFDTAALCTQVEILARLKS